MTTSAAAFTRTPLVMDDDRRDRRPSLGVLFTIIVLSSVLSLPLIYLAELMPNPHMLRTAGVFHAAIVESVALAVTFLSLRVGDHA